jgi:DNA-binding Lrp family transcriptional regulator
MVLATCRSAGPTGVVAVGGGASVDELDRRLLGVLRVNARLTTTELARRLGVARSTVQERLARLERSGVIAGYTVRLGPAADDGARAVTAHVSITLDPKAAASVVGALSRIEEVRTVHTVSGPFDLVAIVSAATPAAIDRVLDRIGNVPGVERTTSAILLTTRIDR